MTSVASIVDDVAFDARLPAPLRLQSSSHFTPVDVAVHAARWLAPTGAESVLDVGAGAGKFCLLAAHDRRNATFVGVELRGHLVAIATRLATEWKLSNARFVHGDAFDLDWDEFDGFYFFNPFAEQLLDHAFALDNKLDFDRANYDRYVAETLDRLAMARSGTRVVTYHGLGADLPGGYELADMEVIGSDSLELWIQTRARTTRPYRRIDVAE